ncbi:hypothetical protein B0H12DRAFT_1236485 [Mycena haematopus]|nr:hypothetical protein B0H12DRAFT_1236485 [Mycena haematopus]
MAQGTDFGPACIPFFVSFVLGSFLLGLRATGCDHPSISHTAALLQIVVSHPHPPSHAHSPRLPPPLRRYSSWTLEDRVFASVFTEQMDDTKDLTRSRLHPSLLTCDSCARLRADYGLVVTPASFYFFRSRLVSAWSDWSTYVLPVVAIYYLACRISPRHCAYLSMVSHPPSHALIRTLVPSRPSSRPSPSHVITASLLNVDAPRLGSISSSSSSEASTRLRTRPVPFTSLPSLPSRISPRPLHT